MFLFFGVFLFSGLSPVATSFDSHWTVYLVMSLWERRELNVDRYVASLHDYYGVECVDLKAAAGHRVQQGASVDCHGHWYNLYPSAGAILAAPLIWSEVGILRLARPLLSRLHSSQPEITGVLHADYSAAHGLIEMEAASVFLAFSAVLIYWTALGFLPSRRALWLALLFALATSAYSVAGRALWSQTFTMTFLALIVYLLIRAEERPALAAWAGLPVALSYAARPTGSLFVLVFTLYVAVRFRAQLWRYLLAAAPVAVVFFWYNAAVYHSLLTPYYQMKPSFDRPSYLERLLVALAGTLISPGRGLFIYTPVFVFAVWAMIRRRWKAPIAGWLAVLALAHWVLISSFASSWWGGDCYGPRLFADVTPVFVLFLIPVFAQWDSSKPALRVAFIALAILGLGMHLRGGWSGAVYQWNADDHAGEKNWDWSDPPFLRRPLIWRATRSTRP